MEEQHFDLEIVKDEIFYEFKKEPIDYTLEVEKGIPKESLLKFNIMDFEEEHQKPNGYKLIKKDTFNESVDLDKLFINTIEVEFTELSTDVSTISNILLQKPFQNYLVVDQHPNKTPMAKFAFSEPQMERKSPRKNIYNVKAPKQNLLLPFQCLDTPSSKITEIKPSKITAPETLKSLVVVPSKYSTIESSTSPSAELLLYQPEVEPLLLTEIEKVERSQLPTAKIRRCCVPPITTA